MFRKIFYGAEPTLIDADMRNYSRKGFECKALMKDKKGKPVVISQSTDKDFPIWKVEYYFSCVVFATYDEAIAFCRGRFCDLDGKPLEVR